MKESIHLYSLSNGLRCVHLQSAGNTECCGLIIDAGSRDEAEADHGLAHFVEHTIFKGTHRRKSWHILNRMEAVGGELNAYTTKESTAVYTVAPRGNTARAIELLADLVSNSIFPDGELNKERDVVADEIDSYLDIPSEAVWDDFDEIFFEGNPLAHNILGTEQTVAGFNSADCRRWLETHYTTGRMVFFYSGPLGISRVADTAERYLSAISSADQPLHRITPSITTPKRTTRNVGSHQAHTLLGRRIEGLHNPDRHAMALLTNILGGPGMNSLLNIALRERKGLVYTVEASSTLYTDCGLLNIYFGCDHHDVDRCLNLIDDVLTHLRRNLLTHRQLEMAKRQYLGQLSIASDNRESRALAIGRTMLYHNDVASGDKIRETINTLTLDDIARCALVMETDKFSILTLS